MINACSFNCPVKLTIQSHNVTLISVDGEHVVPRTVTTITSFSAERVDFVLNAYQNVGTYWIQVRGFGVCADKLLQQSAVLRYDGSPLEIPATYKPFYNLPLDQGIVSHFLLLIIPEKFTIYTEKKITSILEENS